MKLSESENAPGKVGTKSSTDQKLNPSSFQALCGSSYHSGISAMHPWKPDH